MTTMVHAVVRLDDQLVVVSVHGREVPSAEEWARYMEDYVRAGVEVGWSKVLVGGLALTDGGGPSSAQRAQVVAQLTRPHPHIRGAVVTRSSFVRGIVAALNWLNANIKAYSPHRLLDAMAHLGLPPAALPALITAITELDGRLHTETVAEVTGGTSYAPPLSR
jgi:hypothetical protein